MVLRISPQDKAYIDSLSYEELLRRWCNVPAGDFWFQGSRGEYWGKRMNELRAAGADHVGASKRIGWSGPV